MELQWVFKTNKMTICDIELNQNILYFIFYVILYVIVRDIAFWWMKYTHHISRSMINWE